MQVVTSRGIEMITKIQTLKTRREGQPGKLIDQLQMDHSQNIWMMKSKNNMMPIWRDLKRRYIIRWWNSILIVMASHLNPLRNREFQSIKPREIATSIRVQPNLIRIVFIDYYLNFSI